MPVIDEAVDTLGFAHSQATGLVNERQGMDPILRDNDNSSSLSRPNRPSWRGTTLSWSTYGQPSPYSSGKNEFGVHGVYLQAMETGSMARIPAGLEVVIEALIGIARAAELPEGWFDQGSPRLSEPAQEAAIELVYWLTNDNLLDVEKRPAIVPTPIGGIQFEWSGRRGEIEVEIDNRGRFFILVEKSDGSMYETPRSEPLSMGMALSQIRHILA